MCSQKRRCQIPRSLRASRNGASRFDRTDAVCKPRFDQAPPCREISVARRQRPHRMKMVGENDERVDRERPPFACSRRREPQAGNVLDEQSLPAIQQVHREQPTPAGDKRATIVRHGGDATGSPARTKAMVDYAALIRPTVSTPSASPPLPADPARSQRGSRPGQDRYGRARRRPCRWP